IVGELNEADRAKAPVLVQRIETIERDADALFTRRQHRLQLVNVEVEPPFHRSPEDVWVAVDMENCDRRQPAAAFAGLALQMIDERQVRLDARIVEVAAVDKAERPLVRAQGARRRYDGKARAA